MDSSIEIQHLESRPDKRSQELFIRETGIRASTVWHDRYICRFSPQQIADDRDISVDAVYESLAYCRENWELICAEKDAERERLVREGFFVQQATEHA